MALEALLNATVTRLRNNLGYTTSNCEVQPDGQPPGFAGQLYAAVHAGDMRLDDPEVEFWSGVYSVTVTLTMLTGSTPRDRIGTEVVAKVTTGLLARAKAIARAVHMSYTLTDYASLLMPGVVAGTENGFNEPLRFMGLGGVQLKPASWLGGDGKPGSAPAAVVVEIRFGHARRPEVNPGASED